MVDILHKVGIKSPDDAYQALTTLEGLSGWWTNDTQGESKVGGVPHLFLPRAGHLTAARPEFIARTQQVSQQIGGQRCRNHLRTA